MSSEVTLSHTYTVSFSRLTSSTTQVLSRTNVTDGYLITTPGNGWIWLKNRARETIRKGVIAPKVMNSIKANVSITLAGYNIVVKGEILSTPINQTVYHSSEEKLDTYQCNKVNNAELSSSNKQKSDSTDRGGQQTSTFINQNMIHRNKISVPCAYDSGKENVMSRTSTNTTVSFTNLSTNEKHDNINNITISPNQICIDPSLISVMRKHQIEAAEFLLSRLITRPILLKSHSPKNSISKPLTNSTIWTGAILADDMGTGKVLYCLIN